MKKSVFIVEDHSLMRQGVINYLCKKANFECAGFSADAQGFFDFLAEAESATDGEKKIPAVLITDLNLNGESESGFSLIRKCREKFPKIKIIVYSMYNSPTFVNSAIEAGASGYVTKLSEEIELKKAVDAVLSGEVYVEPQIAQTIVSFEHALSKFTRREISILNLIVKNFSNAEIAEKLDLNKRTVENNISRIYTKTGLNYGEELINYWKQEGGLD